MTNKGTALNEAELAKAADVKAIKSAIKPGSPLPEGFENPPAGEPGHLCLDPQKRYRPDWYSIIIHQTDAALGQTQFFGLNGKEYHVRIGVWVDVPPEIHGILLNCNVNVIEQNYTEDDLRMGRPATRTVKKIPRFSFSAIKSA